MANTKEPSGCTKTLWRGLIILLFIFLYNYGYDAIKKQNQKATKAARTAQKTKKNDRIPQPFVEGWRDTIAPLGNGCCWLLLPVVWLLLWWLPKGFNTAHHLERGTYNHGDMPPWERPG